MSSSPSKPIATRVNPYPVAAGAGLTLVGLVGFVAVTRLVRIPKLRMELGAWQQPVRGLTEITFVSGLGLIGWELNRSGWFHPDPDPEASQDRSGALRTLMILTSTRDPRLLKPQSQSLDATVMQQGLASVGFSTPSDAIEMTAAKASVAWHRWSHSLRETNPKAEAMVKLLHQVLKENPVWRTSYQWRDWVRLVMKELPDSCPEVQGYVAWRSELLRTLQSLEKGAYYEKPLPMPPGSRCVTFSESVTVEAPKPPSYSSSSVTVGPVSQDTPIPPPSQELPNLQKVNLECSELITKWCDYLRRLREARQYEELDRQATLLLLQLPSQGQYIASLMVREKPKELHAQLYREGKIKSTGWLICRLYEIAYGVIHAHFALQREALPPSRVDALLRVLDGYSKNDSIALPKHSMVDVVLGDPCHDLDHHGDAVLKGVRAIDAASMWSHNSRIKLEPKKSVDHETFFHNDLQSERVYSAHSCFRSLCVLTMAALAGPLRLWSDSQPKTRLSQEDYERHANKVRAALATYDGQELLQVKREQGEIRISGLELGFSPSGWDLSYDVQRSFQKRTGPVVSLYRSSGPKVATPLIVQRLIEGTVGNANYVCDAQGYAHLGTNCVTSLGGGLHYEYLGDNRSQLAIQSDKENLFGLGIEETERLLLMQAPELTRVPNTLAFFRDHIDLLGGEQRFDWQQLFRLNLFRAAMLSRALERGVVNSNQLIAWFENACQEALDRKQVRAFCFLVKTQASVTALIRKHSSKEVQRAHSAFFEQAFKFRQELTNLWSTSTSYRRDIAEAALFRHACCPPLYYGEEIVVETARQYIVYCSNPLPGSDRNRREEIAIKDFYVATLLPRLRKLLRQDSSPLDHIIRDRFTPPRTAREWSSSGPDCWSTDLLTICLASGIVTEQGVAKRRLPDTLQHDPILRKVFSETELAKPFAVRGFSDGAKEWICFKTTKNQKRHTIYANLAQPHAPIIQRTVSNGQQETVQEQLVQMNVVAKGCRRALPLDDAKWAIWRNASTGTFVAEDYDGVVRYRFEIDQGGLSNLVQCDESGKHHRVLNPWSQSRSLDGFLRLDRPQFVVLTESESRELAITYSRMNLSYHWNPKKKQWTTSNLPGFFLTTKRMENLVHCAAARDHYLPFFSSRFDHYHILVNAEGEHRLLIPPAAYAPSSKGAFAKQLPRTVQSDDLGDRRPLIFTIDSQGQVTTERPEDYLHLAYTLYTQGRYQQALYYLAQSEALWARDTSLYSHIKDWVTQWPSRTPDDQAFQLQVLLMDERLRGIPRRLESQVLEEDETLNDLMQAYERYVAVRDQVSLQLRLPPSLEKQVQYLAPRASEWVIEQFENIGWETINNPRALAQEATRLQRIGLSLDDVTLYQEAGICQRRKHDEAVEKQWQQGRAKVLRGVLDREIAQLLKALPKETSQVPQKSAPDFTPVPIVPFDLDSWVGRAAGSSLKLGELHTRFTQELAGLFEGEGYADEIGQAVVEDLRCYVEQQQSKTTFQWRQDADMSLLADQLSTSVAQTQRECEEAKRRIASSFRSVAADATLEGLIQDATYCFARGNWQPLIDRGLLAEQGDDRAIESDVKKLLIARANLAHLQRVHRSVERLCQNLQDEELARAALALLNTKRHYNPDGDPLAPALLAIEAELGLIAWEAQVTHIRDAFNHPGSFIHEPIAGGKTTLLRHVIAKIKADGCRLPAVLTYRPLMGMHHPDFWRRARGYGDFAMRLEINRNQPNDGVALRSTLLALLRTLHRGGRVDMDKASLLSLKHSYTLQVIRAIKEGSLEDSGIAADEIQVYRQLLALLKNRLDVGSDELDEVCYPLRMLNYALMGSQFLDHEWYQPALNLMQSLLNEEALLPALEHLRKEREWATFSDRAFKKFLAALATHILRQGWVEAKGLDEEMVTAYLTGSYVGNPESEAKMQKWYRKAIGAGHADLKRYGALLRVLRASRSQQCGVNYGRSSDGVSVKPYRASGQPSEQSKRSLPLAELWEHCLDYICCGVQAKGVPAYVQACLEEAKGQASERKRSIEETDAWKTFQRHFHLPLTQVYRTDHEQIAEKINADTHLLLNFVERVVFRNLTYYEERLEGDAHHIPSLVKRLFGSSGSPNRVHTLPREIHRKPHLIRKKGAVGASLFHMLANYQEGDLKQLDPNASRATQVASYMRPGDVYVDCGPLFPGLSGREIVSQLDGGKRDSFRYIDTKGRVQGVNKNGEIVSVEQLSMSEARHVITHAGQRGTNWTDVPENDCVFVGIGRKTAITEAEQAFGRARHLSRGQRVCPVLHPEAAAWIARQIELEGLHPMTQLYHLLAHNEVEALKKLHFRANQKSIAAIGVAAIDQLMRQVSPRALPTIGELVNPWLRRKVELNADRLGCPTSEIDTFEFLQSYAEDQVKKLQQVNKQIQTAPQIAKGDKVIASRLINAAIQDLGEDHLVFKKTLLPLKTQLGTAENDDEMILEAEAAQQAEVEQEVTQALQLEIAARTQMEQEEREIGLIKRRKRKSASEGRENSIHASAPPDYLQIMTGRYNPRSQLIDKQLFPYLYVTTATRSGGANTWIEGTESEALLGSFAVLVQDFKEKKYSWHPESHWTKLQTLMGTVHEEQLLARRGSGEFHKRTRIYLVDLRENVVAYGNKHFPKGNREEAITQMIHAKIAHGRVPFHKEEEPYVNKWLKQIGRQGANRVKSKLEGYYNRHSPSWKKGKLFQLLSHHGVK